jgi:hypothetical protein
MLCLPFPNQFWSCSDDTRSGIGYDEIGVRKGGGTREREKEKGASVQLSSVQGPGQEYLRLPSWRSRTFSGFKANFLQFYAF